MAGYKIREYLAKFSYQEEEVCFVINVEHR